MTDKLALINIRNKHIREKQKIYASQRYKATINIDFIDTEYFLFQYAMAQSLQEQQIQKSNNLNLPGEVIQIFETDPYTLAVLMHVCLAWKKAIEHFLQSKNIYLEL